MHTAPTLDLWLNAIDQGMRTLFAHPPNQQNNPALRKPEYAKNSLSPPDQATSGALMRINHVGEVCAQALYSAQALASPSHQLHQHFEHARAEETDHLAWTRQRLDELAARPSLRARRWRAHQGSHPQTACRAQAGPYVGVCASAVVLPSMPRWCPRRRPPSRGALP
jgi:ubiquinone biosynthesis monooxygenase Coq7